MELAIFLASLSSVAKLAASSVRCYRAANCTTIKLAVGQVFAGDPLEGCGQGGGWLFLKPVLLGGSPPEILF